jgi:hypothetical protein
MQRGYAVVCTHGHSGSRRGYLCLSACGRRGEQVEIGSVIALDRSCALSDAQVKVDKVEYRRPDPPALVRDSVAGGAMAGSGPTPVLAAGTRMMSPGGAGGAW